MLGVFMCYIMIQLLLWDGIRREEKSKEKLSTDSKEGKGIKSPWKQSA